MNKRNKIILISLLSTIFVLALVIGITKSFMKPIEQGGNITEVSLNSCAKIKLTSTSNVNLSSSYPMSRNKGLQTTPYKFTVTSYCDSYVGFNLYIATLSTNTIDTKYVRYILTESGTKNVIQEGILSSAESAETDFTDTEKTELNTGIKGTYNNIYKIYNESIPLKGNKSYDLYLFLDGETADNTTMGKTFKAGIAVKSYDRDKTIVEYVVASYGGRQGKNNIYHHDGTIPDMNGTPLGEAEDDSYRYTGVKVSNNYICFGSEENTCPDNNLYRIIGVFNENNHGVTGEQLVKIVKNSSIGSYAWNSAGTNDFPNSSINEILNTSFITEQLSGYEDKIATITWKYRGICDNNYYKLKNLYDEEVINATKTYKTKIGMMYVSDYLYSCEYYDWILDKFNTSFKNWLNLGVSEWLISPFECHEGAGLTIAASGDIRNLNLTNTLETRPTFYLNPNVLYISGTGTISDPIRVR